MSDLSAYSSTLTLHRDHEPRRPGRAVAWFLLVLAVCAGAGAALGWIWESGSTPVHGVAYQGKLLVVGEGAGSAFDDTGRFVVLTAAFGAVFGLLASWVGRRMPVVTVAAVLVGAMLASTVAFLVGHALGPAAPVLEGVTDGTAVVSDLTLVPGAGRTELFPVPESPLVVLPLVALTVATTFYLLTSMRATPAVVPLAQPGWYAHAPGTAPYPGHPQQQQVWGPGPTPAHPPRHQQQD